MKWWNKIIIRKFATPDSYQTYLPKNREICLTMSGV